MPLVERPNCSSTSAQSSRDQPWPPYSVECWPPFRPASIARLLDRVDLLRGQAAVEALGLLLERDHELVDEGAGPFLELLGLGRKLERQAQPAAGDVPLGRGCSVGDRHLVSLSLCPACGRARRGRAQVRGGSRSRRAALAGLGRSCGSPALAAPGEVEGLVEPRQPALPVAAQDEALGALALGLHLRGVGRPPARSAAIGRKIAFRLRGERQPRFSSLGSTWAHSSILMHLTTKSVG